MLYMLGVAAMSAGLTVIVVALWARLYLQPRLKQALQSDLDEQVEKAAEVLAERVQEAVRQGLLDGVQSLPSREVLEGASRSLARSGAELVSDRLGQIFGKPK